MAGTKVRVLDRLLAGRGGVRKTQTPIEDQMSADPTSLRNKLEYWRNKWHEATDEMEGVQEELDLTREQLKAMTRVAEEAIIARDEMRAKLFANDNKEKP